MAPVYPYPKGMMFFRCTQCSHPFAVHVYTGLQKNRECRGCGSKRSYYTRITREEFEVLVARLKTA